MNLRVKCLSGAVLRTNFLDYLGNSRITFFMPHPTEGFYLPALEEGFLSCLQYASTLGYLEIDQLLKNATQTTMQHDIINERHAFLDLLNQINNLWL